MNGMLFVSTIRMIKGNLGRFAAVLAIVAIGIAFFVGLEDTPKVMGESVDAYNDEYALWDVTVYPRAGFDDDDVAAIASVEGVKSCEGMYFADTIAVCGDESRITRVHSYDVDSKINRIKLVDGRLPEKVDEVVAETGTQAMPGFAIGDEIEITYPDETDNKCFEQKTVKVVGTVDTPLYLSPSKEASTLSNRTLDTFLFAPTEAFDTEYYTGISVKVEGADEKYCYSDSYEKLCDTVAENIEDFEKNYTSAAEEKIILEAKESVEDASLEYENGKEQYEQSKEYLDYLISIAPSGRVGELMGVDDLEEDIKEAEAELADAEEELEDAEEKVADMEEGKWTVITRESHFSSVTYHGSVDQMKAIADIFPLCFLAVAALVCFTTMTRIIIEYRMDAGTLRALGYTRLQSMAKFLAFAGMATFLGALVGSAVGIAVFPTVIYTTWQLNYILPSMKVVINWGTIALASGMFLLGMMFVTYLAAANDMHGAPAQLMRPKVPEITGDLPLERSALWRRLSFSWKVTLRNILRYFRRFILTVLGVSGCTALLLTGFGVRDSINAMIDIQFDEIVHSAGSAELSKEAEVDDAKSLAKQYAEREDIDECSWHYAFSAKAKDSKGKNEQDVAFEIYSDAKDVVKDYDLRTRIGHDDVSLSDDGIVISEKLSEKLGVKKGDTIIVESEKGDKSKVKVVGIFEFYIRDKAFMTMAGYKKLFDEAPEGKSLYIKMVEGASSADGLQGALVADDMISEIAFVDDEMETFKAMVDGLDAVVITIIVASMALAFVVLGNLINVNISERQREIATLKVLGFRKKEVEDYIYRENNILTVIGAIVGLPMGTALHHYIMRTVELDYVMFGRSVLPPSYLFAFILTIVFGLFVNFVLRKKLSEVKMVESLKSAE